MPNLAEALDGALSTRYGTAVAEPKSATSTARGLRTRIAHLTKELGGTARKVAAAIGISDRQLRRWKSKTPPELTPASLRKVDRAYAKEVQQPRLARSIARRTPPTKVRVAATIRWSNSPRTMYNGGSASATGAHRATTLTGLRMGPVVDQWANVGPEAAAQAFERMVAEVYSAREIAFEGDNVEIEFP